MATQVAAARRRVVTLIPPVHGLVAQGVNPSATSLRDFSVALELVGVVADRLEEENEELAAVLKRAQSDLQHYRELFDLAPGGYLVTDAIGTIVEANAASSTLLHTGEDGLAGKAMNLFVGDGENQTLRAQLHQLRQGKPIHGWEVNVQPEGGASFPATIDVSTARDAEGRVNGLHWQLHDITDRKRAEDKMMFRANHDGLTGLPNRATFEEHLSLAVARARRRDLAVAVLYLDLDDFKRVNDTHGHAGGDELLRQLASRLRWISRDTDLVARLGGDEFAILLSDLTRDQTAGISESRSPVQPTAQWVAGRVQAALRATFSIADSAILVSGSIGISVFPDDAFDERTVLESADAAMYRNKNVRGAG